jgi:hypothetical protein
MIQKTSLVMVLLMAVLIVLSSGIAGCASQAPAAGQVTMATTAAATMAPVATTVPAVPATTAAGTTPAASGSVEYALQPSEIPGNFTLAISRERQASEVSLWAKEHGWTKGYTIVYRKNDPASSSTFIMQNISVYAGANATLAVTDTIDGIASDIEKENNANLSVEKITITRIGDMSGSLKYFDKSQNAGMYVISFAKNGVFMDIETNGVAADYETAKQIATIAAAKIK